MPTNRKENLERFLSNRKQFNAGLSKDIVQDLTFLSILKAAGMFTRIGAYMVLFPVALSVFFLFLDRSLVYEVQGSTYWMWIVGLAMIALVLSRNFFVSPSKFVLFMVVGYIVIFLWVFALAYAYHGVIIDGVVSNNVSDGLYLSFITWTTVGYGDVLPLSTGRYYSMAQGIVSYVMMAAIIAKVLFMIQQDDAQQR